MGIFDDLLAGSDTGAGKMNGVATGIVKENWDDKHQGMVKVEYSIGEQGKSVSGWMPVVSLYGGNGFGVYLLPEVGAEVVIAFHMGDVNCPMVIGSLWNQKNKLPEKAANKENSAKLLVTKGGHQVVFSEEKGKEKLTITTPKKLTFELDDEKEVIRISDEKKKNTLKMDTKGGNIELDAEKSLSLQIGGKDMLQLTAGKAVLKADSIAVEAAQSLQLKGQSSKMQGGSIEIKGSGTLKLESGGVAQLKGSMVKVN